MPRLAIATIAALLLLAGCSSSSDSSGSSESSSPGSSSSSSPSAKPSDSSSAEPTGPECKDVWRAGKTLPVDYTTCVTGGTAGQQDVTTCKDGTQLVAYNDSLYAVTGGKIVKPDISPMQDTEEFGTAYTACTGEE